MPLLPFLLVLSIGLQRLVRAKASHFDLNINWDGLPGDTKGIYGLFRGWLAKGLEGRTCS